MSTIAFEKKHDVDMTEGRIFRHLVAFALPLMLGNVFQMLYNAVDTWVLGNYVSNEAFSGVGSVGPIANMLVGLFTGIASGAGIVIAQYYGAKKEEDANKGVHTAMILTFIASVFVTVVGVLISPACVTLMKVPDDAASEALTYLRIYFLGITGLLVYNMGAGILRAFGDSKRPFYFLIISSLINIAGDLICVVWLGLGVAGVAIATVFSQFISAFAVLIILFRHKGTAKMEIRRLKLNPSLAKKIIRVGIPTGIQMSLVSFSNIFVNSYFNAFGTDCMSGWTAFNKIDNFAVVPVSALSAAVSTFVAQNLGAKEHQRARRGLAISTVAAITLMIFLTAPIMIFAPALVKFFNPTPSVVEIGAMYLRYLTPFYICFALNQMYAGSLRGAGHAKNVTIMMISCFVVIRQAYLIIVTKFISNTMLSVGFSMPFGWICATIALFVYYKKVDLTKNRVIGADLD